MFIVALFTIAEIWQQPKCGVCVCVCVCVCVLYNMRNRATVITINGV